jgi:hypothetical protein
MKALRQCFFLLGLWLLVQPLLHAQNPYERLGVKSDPLTLSQGRYQEFFPNDTLVQIGSVIFNTITQEVVGFVEPDSQGLDFPADVASRWLSPDPLAHMFPEWNPYNHTFNNPVYWTDPDGRCPICPLLAKGGAAAAADAMLQMTFAYAFDDNVNGFSQAFEHIDWGDVTLSGLEGMIPWKAPGGKYGKAAIIATADVMLNAGEAQLRGQDYGWDQAGQDFLIGFIAQLGAEHAGEFMQSKKVQTLLGNKTSTVWDDVIATQPNYPGSVIPKSFELSTEGGAKVWVHGNATEHIAEYAQMVAKNNPPDVVRLASQQQIRSLQSAVNEVTKNGVKYGENIQIGGWDLKFSPPRGEGLLPVLFHAQPMKD